MPRALRALAAAALVLAAPAARAAPPGSPWGKAYFPDVELVTHDGRKVRFYSDLVEGKLVMVNFVYTRCTKICGLATANLARVQRELGDRVGRDIQFYSVSLDPEHDTPEVLRGYAAAFKARPGWTFLTGKKEDVALIRKKFGDLSQKQLADQLGIGEATVCRWEKGTQIQQRAFDRMLRAYEDLPELRDYLAGRTVTLVESSIVI